VGTGVGELQQFLDNLRGLFVLPVSNKRQILRLKSKQQNQTFAFELAHLCQTEAFDPMAKLVEIHLLTMLAEHQS
jgi:hypothetical protein